MNCIRCGAVLEADSKFCVSCGASQEELKKPVDDCERYVCGMPVPPQVENDATKPAKKKSKVNIVKLVVGTLIVLIGLQRVLSAGTSISSTSFGADFYTFTYRGIVAISEILASIQVSLGWVIVAIGAAIDLSAFKD